MNTKKVRFRTANENDIKDIMNIETSSFEKNICENEDVFLKRIKLFPEGFFIMEHDKKVIGYLCSEIWKYKEAVEVSDFELGHSIDESHSSNGTELYISSMGILTNFRGMGLGKLMFEEFLRYMLKMQTSLETIVLIVSENWRNAISIYYDNGFKEISTIRKFFQANKNQSYSEHGIVMRKYL